MNAEGLVRLAESLGVASEDLDDAVHDLAQQVELDALNALDVPQEQDAERDVHSDRRYVVVLGIASIWFDDHTPP